jgi:hypothetical protein
MLVGDVVESLVAEELVRLESPKVEVVIHPSDIVISGRKHAAARAHAIITEQLSFTAAYLTRDRKAQQIEDRLREVWEEVRAHTTEEVRTAATGRLAEIEGELRKADLPYEEWEVLFREKLVVERALLMWECGKTNGPKDRTDLAYADPDLEDRALGPSETGR